MEHSPAKPNPNVQSNQKKKEEISQDRDLRSQLRSALQKTLPPLDNSDISPDFSIRIVEKPEKETDAHIPLSELIKNFFELRSKNVKIRSMIRKAIKLNENLALSHEERNNLWLILADFHQRSQDDLFYYARLVEFSQNNYPDHFLKMIELDVFRTLINPLYVESEKQDIIAKLRNVLDAYAIRNPYIGYCQGFNFIISDLLLQGFSETQAFWIFVYILEVMLPLDYYSSMIGIMVDQKIFLELLRIVSPEIVDKFMYFHLDCSFFTLQWFVCLFSGIANKTIFNLIWDHFLAFGSFYLFKAGLVLIQLTKEKWFDSEDFPELLLKLEESVKNFDDAKLFQTKLHTFYLNKGTIFEVSEDLRTIFKKNIKEKSKKMKSRYNSLNNGKPFVCEEKSPICLDILERNRIKKRAVSFFIFREAKGPEVIEDYMEEREKKTRKEEEEKNGKRFDVLIIGRHHHICNGKYVKTKIKQPSSFHREIEMQEMNPQEIKKKENERIFIIEKSPKIRHFMQNHEENSSFSDKIKEKFLRVFNVLCLRQRGKSTEDKNKKKIDSRFLPVFDYSSEFNTSVLNSRKTYEEGAQLWIQNKKNQDIDLNEYGPEDFFKEIDLQIENVEKIEELRQSRCYSFNSNFINNLSVSANNID